MNLGLTVIFLVVVAPRPAVYVKGHSRAADKVRETIENFTCYRSASAPDSSAMLHVDHVQSKSGRSWLVMYLTDDRHKVLWEGKGEELPWPIPSPLNGLLKNLAKATCAAYQSLPIRKSQPAENHQPVSDSQFPKGSSLSGWPKVRIPLAAVNPVLEFGKPSLFCAS